MIKTKIQDEDMDMLKESGFTGKSGKMVLKEETFAIIGACMEVHKTLGRSFVRKYIKMPLN